MRPLSEQVFEVQRKITGLPWRENTGEHSSTWLRGQKHSGFSSNSALVREGEAKHSGRTACSLSPQQDACRWCAVLWLSGPLLTRFPPNERRSTGAGFAWRSPSSGHRREGWEGLPMAHHTCGLFPLSQGPRSLGAVSSQGPCPASLHHPVPAGWVQTPPVDPLGPVAGSAPQYAVGTAGGGPGCPQG